MKTARYYTDTGCYMGWNNASWRNYSEIITWVRSGNTVRIGDKELSTVAEVNATIALPECMATT